MANLINQDFVDQVVNTTYFQKALTNLPIETKLRLIRILNYGIVKGMGIREIINNVKKVLNISFNNAERTIRTESHRLQEQGHNKEFLDARAQGIDTKMQLLATLDNRTRPQSARMDGQISDNQGRFTYPDGTKGFPGNTGVAKYDINDRERSIQIINGLSPGIRRTREDGIIPFQTYEQWAKDKGLKRNIYGQLLFK